MRIRVTAASTEVLERLSALLPPGARPCSPSAEDQSFGIVADLNGSYQFTRDGSPVTRNADLELALMLLDNQIRIYVGLHAPGRIFVHAGVVAHKGKAILIPGPSFAGKTSLVVALLNAGATYYSDEFAVIDEQGLVHPYAKPLSVRDHEQVQNDREVQRFGAVAGEEPLRVGAVVFTSYRPGAKWKPQQLSPGRGVLAMLLNTLAAKTRSAEVMRAIRRSIDGAVLLEGERGEAADIAQQLLDSVPA